MKCRGGTQLGVTENALSQLLITRRHNLTEGEIYSSLKTQTLIKNKLIRSTL